MKPLSQTELRRFIEGIIAGQKIALSSVVGLGDKIAQIEKRLKAGGL